MVLSVPLRVAVGVGMLLAFLGLVVLTPPTSLWATLVGCLIVLVTIVVGFVQTAAQRRRG